MKVTFNNWRRPSAANRPTPLGLFATLAGTFEIPKKFGVRLENKNVALVLESRAVCLQTAIERIKLRVATKG
jgi:hypothetical protein